MSAEKMLAVAEKDYAEVLSRCDVVDRQVAETAARSGSPEYVKLCELAYRQAIAGTSWWPDLMGAAVLLERELQQRLDRNG